MDYFKTLGIVFSTNYKLAIELTWKNIHEKIFKIINIIRLRNYTLYQNVSILNSLLDSNI